MSRPIKDNPFLLKERLKAARKVTKRDDVVSAEPMAEIAGMSWRNLLDRHIKRDPEFPMLVRGTNGKGYEFNVRAVIDHMIRRCDERIAEQDAESRRLARLTGISLPDQAAMPAMSYTELRAAMAAHSEIERLKSDQGQMVQGQAMAAFLRGYHDEIVVTLTGATARLDPTGIWPRAVREAVDDQLRDLLLAIQRRIDAFIEGYDVPTPQPGGHAGGDGSARAQRARAQPRRHRKAAPARTDPA